MNLTNKANLIETTKNTSMCVARTAWFLKLNFVFLELPGLVGGNLRPTRVFCGWQAPFILLPIGQVKMPTAPHIQDEIPPEDKSSRPSISLF